MLHDILNAHKPERTPATASVISLGQVWVDIMLGLGELPKPGGFAVTDSVNPSVGGQFPRTASRGTIRIAGKARRHRRHGIMVIGYP